VKKVAGRQAPVASKTPRVVSWVVSVFVDALVDVLVDVLVHVLVVVAGIWNVLGTCVRCARDARAPTP